MYAYLAPGDAQDLLSRVAPGTFRLATFSPPYGRAIVDYQRAAETGQHADVWRRQPEDIPGYVAEQTEIVARLAAALADDSTLCVEVDYVRDPDDKSLTRFPDLWRDLLCMAGFRISEVFRLRRRKAMGRRSGSFVRAQGHPGWYRPDNCISDLIVAIRGDPHARLRRDGGDDARLDVAWARRYLSNCWDVPPSQRIGRVGTHPCPQDQTVIRAILRLFSLRGDAIVDPFAGAGTTALVGLEEGRIVTMAEKEEGFRQLIRSNLGAACRPLGDDPNRLIVPGAQLQLDLPDVIADRLRAAFTSRDPKRIVTPRMQQMARILSERTGIRFPPEAIGDMLIAERDPRMSART